MSDRSSTASGVEVGWLTADLPGIGGCIKVEPEDFRVEELPVYRPSGEGEHLFLWVEKRDLSGEQLVAHLARTLGISRGEIGTAGLKDRRGVTRQFASVPRRAEPRLASVDSEAVRVLEATPHGNKLRTGHLQGNRFDVRIRDVEPAALPLLPALIDRIRRDGVPNAYGAQRFGRDGSTLQLGLALLCGEKTERDIPAARRRFLLRLALSAAQSELFNSYLAARLLARTLHQVQAGDVMQVVASGGCFVAEEVEREQQRFSQREINITGPMFGPKMKRAEGEPGNLEEQCLRNAGLSLDHFRRFAKLTPGARRPLLVHPGELSAEANGTDVRLQFQLPAGAYATTLLGEVMKVAPRPDESTEVE